MKTIVKKKHSAMTSTMLLQAYRLDPAGFSAQSSPAVYKAGQVLYYQDHFPAGVYLLKSGCAILRHYLSDGYLNSEEIVAAPAFLGVEDLFTGQPHAMTTMITEDAEVLFFPRQIISSLADKAKGKKPTIKKG